MITRHIGRKLRNSCIFYEIIRQRMVGDGVCLIDLLSLITSVSGFSVNECSSEELM